MTVSQTPGLALIGYRGTGKSTVGQILADRLGKSFIDADLEIEFQAGCSIASIFSDQGESTFRDIESSVLINLTKRAADAVLATGGGVILRESNRLALRRFGFIVWLTAQADTLTDRLGSDPAGRPALTSAGLLGEIQEVLESRQPLYRAVADVSIATDGRSPEEVAQEILDAWSKRAEGPGASP